MTTQGQNQTSSKWMTISEVLKDQTLLENLRKFLENKQKPGGRGTGWTRKLGALYQTFIQYRITLEEFYKHEFPLECPICHQSILNLENLRVYLKKNGEQMEFDFCGKDPSSSHFCCQNCVRTISVKHPNLNGKCHWGCYDNHDGLYL